MHEPRAVEKHIDRANLLGDRGHSRLVLVAALDEVREPTGGAHRDPAAAIASTGTAIERIFAELKGLDRETIRRNRRDKFLGIGRVFG